MALKSFRKYLETRLTEAEITEIEEQVAREKELFESLQKDVAEALAHYMEKNKIGFNELVELLDTSPTQIAKIQKRSANLTLSSLAHIFSVLGQEPHLVFKKK